MLAMLGMFGRRRRRGDSYNPYNDPYGGPQRGYGWGRRPRGGGLIRDACLVESGCCVAEALGGDCLLVGLSLTGQLFGCAAATLVHRPVRGSARALLIDGIHRYRREISAHRRACCRFTPSCSVYAEEAISRYGASRGSLMAARRLLRCRPGGRRGADPLPVRGSR
ncbi:MAG: uncharacterized protein QOJ62_1653 [Actinomycetota bacterium]|nr:uncharacterized protein [Actinomycetota bacterium]